MAKTVSFFVSDLSGDVIYKDQVRIIVEEHRDLPNGTPVELFAARHELKALDDEELDVARIRVMEEGKEPVVITIPRDVFDGLAVSESMAETLKGGIPVTGDKRQVRDTDVPKTNYATLEKCGQPHRGRTTEAEAKLVRENLAAVNERLKRDGHRTIDLTDAAMVERYGLQDLAQ